MIFDVDGVLVDSPHERAWRDALRELMEGDWRGIRAGTSWAPDAFTAALYHEEVAGRPRPDGARAVLAHLGVPDPDGRRAEAYAERKQALVAELIDARAFTAFPDALRFLVAVRQAGLRTAAASSSRNAARLLRAVALEDGSRLVDALDADVSGRPVARGKPDPELFLLAAGELGIAPQEAVVVEDAPAGIAAARAGGMRALGVARAGDAPLLRDAGAHLVVGSLDDVDVPGLAAGRLGVRPR